MNLAARSRSGECARQVVGVADPDLGAIVAEARAAGCEALHSSCTAAWAWMRSHRTADGCLGSEGWRGANLADRFRTFPARHQRRGRAEGGSPAANAERRALWKRIRDPSGLARSYQRGCGALRGGNCRLAAEGMGGHARSWPRGAGGALMVTQARASIS